MKLVIAAVLVLAVSVESARHVNLYKNKRIIKVRVPPRHHPDFYKGPKGFLRPNGPPIRFKEVTYGKQHGPEFIRPNSLPPPPFPFGGYGVAHVKSRPPQPNFSAFPGGFSGSANFGKGFVKEVYHKFPQTYGSNFPHKATVSKFKFPSVKDELRITHTQTQTSAPPPPPPPPTPPSPPTPTPTHPPPQPPASSASVASSYSSSNTYRPNTSFYSSSPHIHSSDDDRGPIREIPAPNLGPSKPESDAAFQVDAYANYGKGPSIDVTNLVGDTGAHQLTFPATEYYSAFGQQSHNFDLVTDNHIATTSSTFGSSDSLIHSEGIDSSSESLYKNTQISASPLPSPSTGYEVTEELHTGSGHAGIVQTDTSDSDASQFFYAPDPDPGAPVHKVPPTKEVFVDEKTAETYVPQLAQQNFQVLEGGSVPAPVTTLSPQELFHLMHGFPNPIIQQAIVAEPVVTILQPNYAYAQSSTPYTSGQYSQTAGEYEQQAGAQYLQQAQELARQHSAYIQQQQQQNAFAQGIYIQSQQQQAYVPQESVQQYQSYDSDYSSQTSDSQSSGESSSGHYEPEASESRQSVTKMDEESLNSVETSNSGDNQVVIHFNKMPEVPFYTTLPNKEAAEALASLQAAGSIGSTYASQTKAEEEEVPSGAAQLFAKLRGDQGAEEDEDPVGGEDEAAAEQDVQVPSLGLPREELVAPQKVEASGERTRTNVEIQKSVSVFETSYPASSLLDDTAGGEESAKKSYGQRIRPK